MSVADKNTRIDRNFGFRSIEVGDRLTASSIQGHAMKHDGSLPNSTILGRAVDPLSAGTGLIRVLLSIR